MPAGKLTLRHKPKYSKSWLKRPAPKLRRLTRPRRTLGGTSRAFGLPQNMLSASPYPVRKNYSLTYNHTVQLTTGVVGLYGAEQIFRLNSLFDPDFTGGGHQPYGYDQVTPHYQKYKVNAVKVRIDWSDPSEDGICCGFMISPPVVGQALAGRSLDAGNESMNVKSVNLNASGSQKASHTFYTPTWLISGLSKKQFEADTDQYSAATTVDPVKNPFLRISAARLAIGAAAATVFATVRITYYATFWQRVLQAQS